MRKNSVFTRAAKQLIRRYVGDLSTGRFELYLPGGEVIISEGAQPGDTGVMVINKWRTLTQLMRRGDIGLAEAYAAGDWDSPNLSTLMSVLARNIDRFKDSFAPRGIDRVWAILQHALRRNTKVQSRKNIEAHYDLGNAFYSLWLDPTMTYSSALFEAENDALEAAQKTKYQRILEQANVAPNSHILEIGCGWGGFAEVAAEAGHRVTGLTISPAQLEFAQKRLKHASDQGTVNLLLQDYRDLEGRFDAVVSIEMFEAVGPQWWSTYMGKVQSALKPGAKAVIQTITMQDQLFDDYSKQPDFIQTCIFPGSMLSCPERFVGDAQTAGMRLTDQHEFGASYARTLRQWQTTFNAAQSEVRHLGFDTEFLRLWNFYYSYCVGGFEAERTNVGQYTFEAA